MIARTTLICVAVAGIITGVAGSCEWTGPSGKEYDFTRLVLPTREYIIPGRPVPNGVFTFFYNFCGGIVDPKPETFPGTGCGPTDAACQANTQGQLEYYSLGKLDTASWTETSTGVVIKYTGGSSAWLPLPRSVIVTLTCDPNGQTKFLPGFEDPNAGSNGMYYINATLPDACGKSTPVLPTTCQEVLYENPDAKDGEYELHCPESKITMSFWCHGMATGSPQEFLTLVQDDNFAEYLCGTSCKNRHPNSTTVTTRYSKLRINPCNLTVNVQDRTFASSTGSLTHGDDDITTMAYGTAGSCETGQLQPGRGHINLDGTKLEVESSFTPEGSQPYGTATFDATHQQVSLSGGGYCGEIAPTGFMRFLPRDESQFVLKLKPATIRPPSKVEWAVDELGESCTQFCQTSRKHCVENEWPKSISDFQKIVDSLPGTGPGAAQCTTVQTGNYPPNPQRNSRSGPGICYWDGEVSTLPRCGLSPSTGQSRFCPCVPDETRTQV